MRFSAGALLRNSSLVASSRWPRLEKQLMERCDATSLAAAEERPDSGAVQESCHAHTTLAMFEALPNPKHRKGTQT